jgi:hypothetical protein
MRMSFCRLLGLAFPAALAAQPGAPLPTPVARHLYLFTLDLQGTALDEFPDAVKALNGVMTVVDKNGQHMLMASSPSELLITLPQVLPSEFAVEVDLIPKRCCNPDDIMLEGTPTMNRGPASVQLTWQPERISAVGGGGEMYQSNMPDDLAAATPGNLTHLVFAFNGTTIKLYTNGRRLYTLEKQFVRGRVLRVWLGGESATNPMYLAGLRISGGAWNPEIASGGRPGAASAATGVQDQPAALGKSNLPVVKPDTTTPTPAPDTAATSQQTAQHQEKLTGSTGPLPDFPLRATVDAQGQSSLSWPAVTGATSYFAVRWLVGHPDCCSDTSPPSGMSTPAWKSAPFIRAGTYGFRVYASTPTGLRTAETTLQYPPPLQALAILNVASGGPLGIIVGWGVFPDATAYRVYRAPGPTQPGVLLGTGPASVESPFFGEGMSGAIDAALGADAKDYRYWVQAVLSDGSLSDPGPIVPVTVQSGGMTNPFGGALAPTGVTPSVGGTTTITFNGQQARGSKVTWDWDPEPPMRPVNLYFATVEVATGLTFGGNWSLLRSETIQLPGIPLFPYLQEATVSGPPYVAEIPAGYYVRFCLSYFPMTAEQRNDTNYPACVISQTPP